MSKDEDVKKIVDILIDAGLGAKLSVKGIFKLAGTIYNAGFRDVEKLRKWLEDMIEKSERLSKDENGDDIEMYCGASSAYIQILDRLEQL